MSKPSQLTFDWLLGSREWFSPKEAAAAMGMRRTFVEELLESGELAGYDHNAAGKRRWTKRIHRSDMATYLARQANHDAEHRLQLLRQALQGFGKGDLIEARRHIDHLLTR